MPVCPLPSHASLEHLRNQAKLIQRAVRAADPWGLGLVAEFHPKLEPLTAEPDALTGFRRADAQHVVARQYGFASWAALRRGLGIVADRGRSPHLLDVDGDLPTDLAARADRFLRLACLTYGADHPDRRVRASALLAAHPEIAASTIHTAAGVGDVAAIRRLLAVDPTAANAEGGPFRWTPLLYLAYARVDGGADADPVTAARVLLDAGADPNAGYMWEGLVPPFTVLTGLFGEGEQGPVNQPRHPRCIPLARLLLAAGADPNDGQTLYNRMFRSDDEHLEVLLPAGLGRGDGGPWKRLLGDRLPTPAHLVAEALERAVEFGHGDRVALLLAHAIDPDPGVTDPRPGARPSGGPREDPADPPSYAPRC
ncbi:hypothetical protein BH23ACT9_BH23ACT9_00100 [soil metagenome]